MAQVRFLKINGTYGYHEQHDPTSDELTLFGLAMNGDIAMGSNEVTGLPATPTSGDSAASKSYVDNQISGMTWKDPAVVLNIIDDSSGGPPGSPSAGDAYVVDSATGDWSGFSVGDIVEYDGSTWNTIVSNSGGFVPDGTRVVVSDSPGGTGSFNGHDLDIGTADGSGSWSFTDPQDGWAILINGENGYYENTSWVYDTSTPEWVQFSGAGQINAGAGLGKSGNTVSVNFGDGITETPSDYVGIDLVDTNPGLELTGTSPNKELQVQVDGAHGIILGASGVEIEIDDTPDTLDVDGDGLKVVGLPSLFKINGTAVGATVTAANLDTLTDGSNADALHTHTIDSVDEAKRVEDTHLNNVAVAAGDVVRWSGTNNEVTPADNSTIAGARAVGVARTGGASNPGTSEVVKHGVCAGILSSATVNTPYFLGATGALVTWGSLPTPGRIIRVGYALNATDLDVQIMDLGYKAV